MAADNRGVRFTWIAALAALVLLGGCGGSGGNKAGAPVAHRVSLVYEVPDDGDPPAAVFAQAAARHSRGTVQVKHDEESPYTSADPKNELRLVHALEDGAVPVAYLPARAFAVAGVPAFRALLVPFVLTTEDASRALALSAVARDVLQSLPNSVIGLALVPQEARRILAVRPPTSLRALDGLRIRIVDNPQTAADLRAVGAIPVEGLGARTASRLLLRRRLDGVESAPTNILGNGYQTLAHYFSTWSPFAKFQVIVMNRKAWNRLSPAQQAALRQAAHITVAYAARTVPNTEKKGSRACAAPPDAQHSRHERSSQRSPSACVRRHRGLAAMPRRRSSSRAWRACPEPASSRSDSAPVLSRHPTGFFTTQTGGPKIPPGTYKVTISRTTTA